MTSQPPILSRIPIPSEIISHVLLALLPFRLEFPRCRRSHLPNGGITVTYEAIRLVVPDVRAQLRKAVAPNAGAARATPGIWTSSS